jgi:hypothetical protein
LNISQYHPVAVMPTPGELVEVQFERSDRGAWINSLKIIGAASLPASERDRAITRLACLKAAATFASGRAIAGQDVSSSDVIKVAEAFEKWVLKGGERTV